MLHNLGIDNVNVIGCPSFYENGEKRIIQKKENLSEESVLLSSYNVFPNSNYHSIMQDWLEEDIIKWIAYNKNGGKLNKTQIQNIYNHKYKIFSNITEWKNFVKNFNFVIGSRVHGSILSLNSGVPAVCTNSDSRAREMCGFLKIPHLDIGRLNSFDDIIAIYEQLDYSEMNLSYPLLYKNFQQFMQNNGIAIKTNSNDDEFISMAGGGGIIYNQAYVYTKADLMF